MSSWSTQIEKELDWREDELTMLKILTVKAHTGSTTKNAQLRALTVMLYAHYEGFCKFIWDLYLDEITKSRIKRKDCCEAIIIFSLKKKFKELSGNFSPRQIWDTFSTHLPQLLDEEIEFNYPLETNSNLWPDLLKSNLEEVALHCAVLDSHETALKALLNRRNDIAHGQQNIIRTLDEYENYEKAVFDILYELSLTVIDNLDHLNYRNE